MTGMAKFCRDSRTDALVLPTITTWKLPVRKFRPSLIKKSGEFLSVCQREEIARAKSELSEMISTVWCATALAPSRFTIEFSNAIARRRFHPKSRLRLRIPAPNLLPLLLPLCYHAWLRASERIQPPYGD